MFVIILQAVVGYQISLPVTCLSKPRSLNVPLLITCPRLPTTVVAFCWKLYSFFTSFCNGESPDWTVCHMQPHQCQAAGKITFPDLPAMLLLMCTEHNCLRMTMQCQLIGSGIHCNLLILFSSPVTHPVHSQLVGMQRGILPQLQNFAFFSTGLHEVSVGAILRCLRSISIEDVIHCVSQLSSFCIFHIYAEGTLLSSPGCC